MSSSIVTNLYFRFEMQQASISVSTLKCDPYDDSVTLADLDSNIKDIKAGITKNAADIAKLVKFSSPTKIRGLGKY